MPPANVVHSHGPAPRRANLAGGVRELTDGVVRASDGRRFRRWEKSMDVFEEFKRLVSESEKQAVRYVLVGGVAMAFYTEPSHDDGNT